MAGVIATLLAAPKTINILEEVQKGPARHTYEELTDLQAANDPALVPPYVAGDGQSTIAANGGSTGNFTITISFPLKDVEVTTGNILFSSANAAIETLVDAALAGEVLNSTYVAGDVAVGLTANASSASFGLSANGTTATNLHMVVTTTNVDMDVATPAVTIGTYGTTNRAAEALLALYSVVTPAVLPTPQGVSPSEGDYVLGTNPFSISPGTQDNVMRELTANENKELGEFLRTVVGCI